MAYGIIRAGVVILVYMFIVMIAFFCLSPFMDSFVGSFEGGDYGDATDEVQSLLPDVTWAFNMAFALFAAIPVTWFIVWVFSRDPSWQYKKYY